MVPKKLTVKTDGNELEFVRIIKEKEILYEYKFTKSETKTGMSMTLSKDQLEKSLNQKIFLASNED